VNSIEKKIMTSNETIILRRQQVAELLSIDECIDAIEGVFNLYGKGEAAKPGILGIHTPRGGFHMKAGALNLGKHYFVAKTNANFPDNARLHSLPTIQGVISVFDGENGRLLALMDSIEISILRTGAATAVAAKYLARKNSKTLTICGNGNQGRISLKCLDKLFSFDKIYAYDIDEDISKRFTIDMTNELDVEVESISDLKASIRQSDICVTCTPSKQAYLNSNDIAPGTFIAAVGSDNEDKQELDAGFLANTKIVTDVTDQCATIGELHHALRHKLLTKENVYAELGQVVAGRKKGRESENEIIVFDSTGMALQDVAAAVIVYEKALQKTVGLSINLDS
jgi:alanine dehydrogenase